MTPFYKLSGAGNDFLALVEPDAPPEAEQIRAWCRRRLSLGGDGLLVLQRQDGKVRMVHYNQDGSRSDLCLNGSRCVAQLAHLLGWSRDGRVDLLTDIGELAAYCRDESSAELVLPPFAGHTEEKTLKVDGKSYTGWRVEIGVPHFVLPWATSLAEVPMRSLAPRLRAHPGLGPEGANVDFVRWTARERFHMRTFERGVEGETLACGTGAVATAWAGTVSGILDLPARAMTASGFELTVNGQRHGQRLEKIVLSGDARVIARGTLHPGALLIPQPPPWG